MPLQQGAVFETGGDDCEAAGDGRGHVEAAAGTLAAAIVSVTDEIGRHMHEADGVGLCKSLGGAERMVKQRIAEETAGIGGGADGHAESGQPSHDALDRQRAG